MSRVRVLLATFVVAASVTLLGACASGDDGVDIDPATTFGALDRAAADTSDCMEERGFEVVGVEYDEELFVHSFDMVDAGVDLSAAYDECLTEHYIPVSQAWQALNADEIESMNAAYESSMLECLADAGIEAEALTSDLLDALSVEQERAYEGCVVEVLDS